MTRSTRAEIHADNGSGFSGFVTAFPALREGHYIISSKSGKPTLLTREQTAEVHAAIGAWLDETAPEPEPERVYVRDGDEHLLHFSSGPEGTFKHLRCVKGFCEVVADPADFHPAPEPAPAEPETDLDGEVARKPIGSKAVVLGDAGDWDHGFAPGTVVEILIDDVDLDGSYYVVSDETGGSGYVAARDLGVCTPEPRKLQVGDRVIRVSEEHRAWGSVYTGECEKGSIGSVRDPRGPGGTIGVRWDAGRGSYLDADNLVAFEPLTTAPRAGDTVVVINGGGNPTFAHYPVGHVGTVTSTYPDEAPGDGPTFGETLVYVTGLERCGGIYARRLGRVLS